MNENGRGGFWNRAGRRSGGPRKFEIVVPFACPHCGNDDPAKMTKLLHVAAMREWERCDACGKATGRTRHHR